MKKLALIASAVLAALALAASAGAVNLPPSQSQITSASIQDGRILWFQRNDRVSHKKRGGRLIKRGVGAIYARALDSKQATRVYMPPPGNRIVSFKARSGRIVLGLATIAKDDRGPSSIVELTASQEPNWSARTLATESDPIDGVNCGSRVHLVDVRSDGKVLAERSRLEARGDNCLLVRQHSSLISLDADATEAPIGVRTSGWASERKWNLLPSLIPIATDALLQLQDSSNGMRYPTSLWTPADDALRSVPGTTIGATLIEPLGSDALLLRAWSFSAEVLAPASDPMKVTALANEESVRNSWYRACGNRLLEIHRRYGYRPGIPKWKLTLRKPDGEAIRTLKQKLPAGAAFDACDQSTAVFHRPRHDGGIRQWAVSLGS